MLGGWKEELEEDNIPWVVMERDRETTPLVQIRTQKQEITKLASVSKIFWSQLHAWKQDLGPS